MTGEHVSARWAHWREQVDLAEYHARWAKLEAAGHSTHGEADLIERYVRQGGRPPSVLDAGCGMGRVAIELHHRGIEVEGADLDADLLAYAQADAPHVVWHLADLAEMALGRTYGVVAMPGNVMLFCAAAVRADVVARCAAHLAPGGLLVAGFSIDGITLDEYDGYCAAAGLALHERFATWEKAPFAGGNYAVSVHRLAG
ncbi:MAG: class I SAM-dependent methyltransferase [Ilumatobacteraceae bacterium]|nr:class I SAM-dependent methyltransferase [Ilumatobacter sp.]MCO5332194.1 class I SAM-dependent methyltransferase [Ilumatobacteraceae bacterium]